MGGGGGGGGPFGGGQPPNIEDLIKRSQERMKSFMPGGMGMPATTMTQCVKPADVQDGKRTVPQQDPKCEMKDYKMQGNTASWRFECKGPEAMSGSGSMTYSGNSYSGTTKMSMKQQGRVINMTQSYSGKRLGDCK